MQKWSKDYVPTESELISANYQKVPTDISGRFAYVRKSDWWDSEGKSGGPSDDELKAAGFTKQSGTPYWNPPKGWVKSDTATMGWEPPKVGQEQYTYYLKDQPKTTTVNKILQDHPSLSALPIQTLEAMAKDWQNAYSRLSEFSPQESLQKSMPTGYTPARIKVVDGQLQLPIGGQGEVLSQAVPYIAYSPEYGLVMPEQGIRPVTFSGGLMSLIPGIIGGVAFGPLAAALGGGALGAAAAGALTGAGTASVTGGDVLKGALTGGITAGLTAGATPKIDAALKSANITGPAASAIKSGALAAGKAAITGGDPFQSALMAAAGSGAGTAVASLSDIQSLDPPVAKAVAAAASGAARALVGGGDPISAALSSAIDVGTKAVGKTLIEAAKPDATKEILSNLSQQEYGEQQLQQLLADAGIVFPEQAGLLEGDYKQQGLGDEISRLAESALGSIIPSAQATGQDRLVLPGPEKAEGAQPSDYRYFFDIMAQPDPQAAYAGLSAEQKAAVERASSEFGASSDERKLEMMTAYRTGALAPSETPTESWIDQAGLMPYETGDILDFLAQQEKEQAEMVAALEQKPRPVFPMEEQPTDLGNLIQLPSQDILQRMDQQAAEQRQMEQAVQTATGAPDALFEQRLSELLAQQDAEQEVLAQALRGEIGGLGGTFSEQIAQADARRQAEQAAMEAALRGEYQSGFGSLEQQLAQQSAEQAAMESSLRSTFDTGMSDLERQIIAQAEQEAAERAAMEKALAEMGASTQQQIGQVETGLGQQISGLGQTIGGLSQQIGTATQGLQQQVARAQQQADLSGLLGLLGLMQQKEQPPAPIPVVGEIKPYEFGSNLLEGIYPSNKMGLFGANDQLLKMARG